MSFTVSMNSFWTSSVIDFINPTALYMCYMCFARTGEQAENIIECFPNHASHFSWAPSSRFRYSPGKLKWIGDWSQLFQSKSVCLCGLKLGLHRNTVFAPMEETWVSFVKPTVLCCTVHLMYWCDVCLCTRYYKLKCVKTCWVTFSAKSQPDCLYNPATVCCLLFHETHLLLWMHWLWILGPISMLNKVL